MRLSISVALPLLLPLRVVSTRVPMSPTNQRGGITAAAVAYFLWGLFPLYWSLLAAVPNSQLLAHRVAWCAVAVWLYLLLRGDAGWWRSLPLKVAGWLTLSALLISVNWGVYILGINTGHVLDTSLGYFITPLVNVLFGVLVLRERLSVLQWLAVVCAAVGVAYLALRIGSLPWIALVLAVSFACYGLIRKLTPVDAIHGLAMESAVLLLPSLGWLLWSQHQGTGVFLHEAVRLDVLMIVGGVVTSIPLVLFGFAARRVSMTVLGFLQYLAPTVALLLAVFLFHEPFGPIQQVAFAFIWLALVLFSFDALRRYRRPAA